MALTTQLAQIQMRRDTAANWTSNDPTPSEGEWCLETDTSKIKIGDGATAWTSLEYLQTVTAWVNFNGTGTPSIRDSFNVSSITDNGTGDYTVNFSNALSNTDYTFCAGAFQTGVVVICRSPVSQTTTTCQIITTNTSGVNTDSSVISIHIFGGK